MTLKKFIRDHLFHIVFFFGGMFVLDVVLWLDPSMRFAKSTLLYLDFLLTIFFCAFIIGLYLYHLKWYRAIQIRMHAQEDGLNWPLTGATSAEKQFIQDYVNQLLDYHQQSIERLIHTQQDQKAFIDSWVHEIKVPLAATQLLVDSVEMQIPDEKFNQLTEELVRIEHYVEQVLYYSRLDSFSKDYLVQETALKPVINQVIRQNSHYFIQKKLHFELTGDQQTVLTDAKWLSFILNQIISNAIKYTPDDGQIKISLHHDALGVWLDIHDSGIGIPAADLPRIFDKGFTGQNGRLSNRNSTGLGLYLAKELSLKLGHELYVESTVDTGTTFKILFPFLSYYNDPDSDQLFGKNTKS
ncbi:sensor histidine kinase [Latilactobacillus fuchuensis]|jgi:signal transduction histidine kinase|uniref:histidine kinase n=2 Tax=Latilactobacillus fuchuensis TaxID=164393 RepID=A0A2N9DWY7_9LACO|nr:sensor histidine kinase [Latilactobacillus fuchuensis]KRL60048.1 his Kinase A domain protein [Latilactobacillus fuchuensis DSM 14340 = JCM 11249]MCP8857922.1 sensor histidine kinase [Latilactobacillus fuchuensis]SPC39189.1 Sensor histidine kinase [Latilactobacillus fuchuensis]